MIKNKKLLLPQMFLHPTNSSEPSNVLRLSYVEFPNVSKISSIVIFNIFLDMSKEELNLKIPRSRAMVLMRIDTPGVMFGCD